MALSVAGQLERIWPISEASRAQSCYQDDGRETGRGVWQRQEWTRLYVKMDGKSRRWKSVGWSAVRWLIFRNLDGSVGPGSAV